MNTAQRDSSRWVLLALIGVTIGVTAFFINLGSASVIFFKTWMVENLLSPTGWLHAKLPEWREISGFVVTLVYNLIYAQIAAGLVCYVAPSAGGSGVPELKARLNGIETPGHLTFRTYLIKVIGTIFSMGSGFPIGKEASLIHCGASLGNVLSSVRMKSSQEIIKKWRLSSVTMQEPPSFNIRDSASSWREGCGYYLESLCNPFRTEADRRLFIAAGAGAGVAAAFSAPVGGMLFALEEGGLKWSHPEMWRMLFCSTIAVSTLAVLTNVGLLWKSNVFSNPQLVAELLPNNSKHEILSSDLAIMYQFYDIPIFMLIGGMGGILGAIYNKGNRVVNTYRRKYLTTDHMRMYEVIFLCFVCTIAGFAIPHYAPMCSHDPTSGQEQYAAYKIVEVDLERWTCNEGESSDTASLFFASTYAVLHNVFHNIYTQFSDTLLATKCVLYAVLMCWTAGAAIPQGSFVPALLVGALYGRIFGQKMHDLNFIDTTIPTFSLIGAASFLAGTTRVTVSLVAILVESSDSVAMMLPLLLAVMCAKFMGDLFEVGSYEVILELKKIPYLEPHPEDKAEFIDVADVMSTSLVTLPQSVQLHELLHILRWTEHSSFPVVKAKDDRTYLGLIHRDYILCLLSMGPQILHGPGMDAAGMPEPLHNITNELFPTYPSLREATDWLLEEHLQLMLALIPYTRPCAQTLQKSASMARAHYLFVSGGLRSMPILAEGGQVIGIVTRLNLMKEAYTAGLQRVFEREKKGEIQQASALMENEDSKHLYMNRIKKDKRKKNYDPFARWSPRNMKVQSTRPQRSWRRPSLPSPVETESQSASLESSETRTSHGSAGAVEILLSTDYHGDK